MRVNVLCYIIRIRILLIQLRFKWADDVNRSILIESIVGNKAEKIYFLPAFNCLKTKTFHLSLCRSNQAIMLWCARVLYNPIFSACHYLVLSHCFLILTFINRNYFSAYHFQFYVTKSELVRDHLWRYRADYGDLSTSFFLIWFSLLNRVLCFIEAEVREVYINVRWTRHLDRHFKISLILKRWASHDIWLEWSSNKKKSITPNR